MDLGLLRHAKSSWDDDGLHDHDRPLSPRGERAATLMGAYIAQQGLEPALVLCSSARRAVDTCERVLTELAGAPPLRIERDLYLADPDCILACLASVEATTPSVLVVGHNPGLGELAAMLAGVGEEAPRRRLKARFPTAAYAALRFTGGGWGEIAVGGGELLAFETPKSLV